LREKNNDEEKGRGLSNKEKNGEKNLKAGRHARRRRQTGSRTCHQKRNSARKETSGLAKKWLMKGEK